MSQNVERYWCIWAVLSGVAGVVMRHHDDEAAALYEYERLRAQLDEDREVVAYGLAAPGSICNPGLGNTPMRAVGAPAEIGDREIERAAAFMTRMGWHLIVEGEDEGR